MTFPLRLSIAFLAAMTWIWPARSADPDLTLDSLTHRNHEELQALYCGAQAGPIPQGYTRGLAFRRAGTCLAGPSTKMTGLLWHGKIFNDCTQSLQNQWCLGITAVEAKVGYGESWLDGQPAIIMDYRGTSPIVWRHVRDELRQIGPHLYLGAMFQEKHSCQQFKMFFALEIPPCCPAPN